MNILPKTRLLNSLLEMLVDELTKREEHVYGQNHSQKNLGLSIHPAKNGHAITSHQGAYHMTKLVIVMVFWLNCY